MGRASGAEPRVHRRVAVALAARPDGCRRGIILTLAWLKARVILGRYLGLAAAPFWRRGFNLSLALFCLLLLGLYLVPLAV